MREIKFRGRTSGSNEWVYGSYQADVMHQGTHTIMYCDYEGYYMEDGVDPETVGQYTGLKDKNGKEIYEGDIVSTDLSRPYLIVEFRNGAFMYQCHHGGQDYYDHMEPAFEDEKESTKYHAVIGNIYENPELLQ